MRKVLYIFIVIIISVSLFIFNRYKTKQLEYAIGYNQEEVEQHIDYPNENTHLEKLTISQLDKDLAKRIQDKGYNINPTILRYTLKGSVRQHTFWLVDDGSGYKVIEAIDTNI